MKITALLIVFAGLAFVGCTSTKQKVYDDGGTIYLGKGGAKEIKDGIEIWSEGSPPRPYKILAVIHDDRPVALIPMAQFNGMVVARTKKAGGDAAIIRTADSYESGTVYIPGSSTTNFQGTARPTYAGNYQISGSANTTTMPGYAVNARRSESVIDIIKYVPENELPEATPTRSTAPNEDPYTAEDYEKAALSFEREGNHTLAEVARRRAAKLRE